RDVRVLYLEQCHSRPSVAGLEEAGAPTFLPAHAYLDGSRTRAGEPHGAPFGPTRITGVWPPAATAGAPKTGRPLNAASTQRVWAVATLCACPSESVSGSS